MFRNNYIIGAIIVLILVILGYWYVSTQEDVTDVTQEFEVAQEDNVQLPNPASVHCTEALDGILEIVDTSEGQIGVCHLRDGRQCEEWELYRTGTCVLPSGLEPLMPFGDKGGLQAQ